MDPIVKWHFLLTFSWAAETLMREEPHLGWTPEELAWPEKVRMGKNVKLPGSCRVLQDRFAMVFADFFQDTMGSREEYFLAIEELKRTVFYFSDPIPASPAPV